MKFTAAIILAAAGVHASVSNVTYVTEVLDVYVTYCPEPTEVTQGGKTYTVTAPTTLTITDCPCTVVKPVTKTACVQCSAAPTPKNNGTAPPATGVVPVPSGSGKPAPVPTAGAGKAAVMSGASLAGLVGLAALVL